jgi:hypothetical protein
MQRFSRKDHPMPDQFRALDHITGWQGPVRDSIPEAQADVDQHDQTTGRSSTGILTPTVVEPKPKPPKKEQHHD